MIDIRNVSVVGWQQAIHGMRNSWNSWEKSDTTYKQDGSIDIPGKDDYELMKKLSSAYPSHAKFRRMITVYCNITAPLYWWKEFDTYKVGTVTNSTSTMHTIAKKPFSPDSFSHEHLLMIHDDPWGTPVEIDVNGNECYYSPDYFLRMTCEMLNHYRKLYLETKDKKYWWQMIQLLPSSYNQTRTVMMNYEVLSNIYKDRSGHRLDEWQRFCSWAEGLQLANPLITGKESEGFYGRQCIS